ncbi:MAG TPA: phosphoribosylformylglycinamidine synthase subunit PurS [bacterium]|nr:phosphoribosylformylglycinamidine synthase subunit PurS [bacterium]HPP29940.1 phosphoribosylformylglycinamidine synthase subunit PurS [bacterium]
MGRVYLLEICNKEGIPDVFGIEIKKSIRETGIPEIESVLTSDLYHFEGDLSSEDITKIAEDVLLDGVIQEYFLGDENIKRRGLEYPVVIDVFYKKGVTDAVADTVSIAIKDAGIKKDVKVSTGKRYYLKGQFNREELEKICDKVLANRLVQEYSINILEEKNG